LKTITSSENPRFRALLKLAHSARERRTAGKSLLDGIHLVGAYVEHVGHPEELVLSRTGSANAEIMQLVESLNVPSTVMLTDALFRELSALATPVGILAVVSTPRIDALDLLQGASVWLHDIQDPGNLGSILRSSAAAGIPSVCLSKHSVHAWSPRVLRAGMGAHFAVKIIEGVDFHELSKTYDGRILATSVDSGTAVFDADLTGNVAFLFGNEGAGLPEEIMSLAAETINIPVPGKAESLNVGAAAAVCLFGRVRQMRGQ